MNSLLQQAKLRGYPYNTNLRVTIAYTPENSGLAKALNRVLRDTYLVAGIVERGVLIGVVGHEQLIEWQYVEGFN